MSETNARKKQSLPKRMFMLAIQGILTIFPLVVTIYLVWWFGSSIENGVHKLLDLIFGEGRVDYFPGLGIIVGLAVLLGVGWLVNAYFMRKIIKLGDAILERIPVIKTVYVGLRDFVGFMSATKKQTEGSAVLVPIGDKKLIGIITDYNAGKTLGTDDPDLVGVYMPLGYMIGGYVVYVNRNELTRLSISSEAAMRLALTGGMTTEKSEK
ncbi:MAG: DUF502 domain-containing protein [Helicobacteraceae bacterium]|jgi:uncharacterized membrane protein|nr:DUF502 domain-containing protein [Helicobacteraceae bacterium]